MIGSEPAEVPCASERLLATASAGSCAFENGAKICLELGLHGATDQLAAESYAQ